jgi:Tfp pilus assembly protein PilV
MCTPRRRSGLSALEVLVATTLASLMLAAVAGVLGALARQERSLRRGQALPAWQQSFADQLLWDLRNSRRMSVTNTGVWLSGYGSRDFATGCPTGRCTHVNYFLRETNGEKCLVRFELQSDSSGKRSSRNELVCCHASHLKFEETLIDQPVPAATALQPPPDDKFVPVPNSIRLWFASTEAAGIEKTLCIR